MAPNWPQEALPEALLGPSWGSKLGPQLLRKCAFRVSEMLFFAFGGRLRAEATPTKTEEPQEEAKDGQKVAPTGSRGGLGMRDAFRPEVNGARFGRLGPWERLAHAVYFFKNGTYTPTYTGSNTPWA